MKLYNLLCSIFSDELHNGHCDAVIKMQLFFSLNLMSNAYYFVMEIMFRLITTVCMKGN